MIETLGHLIEINESIPLTDDRIIAAAIKSSIIESSIIDVYFCFSSCSLSFCNSSSSRLFVQ